MVDKDMIILYWLMITLILFLKWIMDINYNIQVIMR